jgi:hypothetical protein
MSKEQLLRLIIPPRNKNKNGSYVSARNLVPSHEYDRRVTAVAVLLMSSAVLISPSSMAIDLSTKYIGASYGMNYMLARVISTGTNQ